MKRRGLSTVVGAVFAIIALTSTVTYVSYSMGVLDNYNQSVLSKYQQTIEMNKESFQISNVGITSSKLNITITNTGSLPINFTKIWIQNTTDNDWVRSYVSTNTLVGAGATLKNIGQNIPLNVKSTQSYHIKLVTSRGNTQEFSMNSAGQAPLQLQLFTIPSTVPSGFTSTIMFAVTNNMSNNAILTNIQPSLSANPSSLSTCSNSEPASYYTLRFGNTAYFQWTCTITGNAGDSVVFTAQIQNGYPGDSVQSTVTIGAVPFAGQSQSSLSAQGLTALATNDDQLILHQEATTIPANGYQMYSIPPDFTGKWFQIDAVSPSFYTNNDTNMVTTTIPAGKWNATLRYISSPLPSTFTSVQQADMIFHFNTNNPPSPNYNSQTDSSGFSNGVNLGASAPQYISSGPTMHDGTGYYSFTGSSNQYLTVNTNSHNNIGASPDSTAAWFKVTTPPSAKEIIYRVEGPPNYYEISMNSAGNIVFSFDAGSGGNEKTTTCTSPGTYKDGNWHQFVAVRDAANRCKLYMDGNQNPVVTQDNAGNAGNQVSVSSSTYIGKAPSGSSFSFTGALDDIIHWNNYAVAPSQVQDLYNANYGIASHKVNFAIDVVNDLTNVVIQHVNQTSISNFPLSFQDPVGWTNYNGNPPPSNVWGQSNFTFTANQLVLTAGQRLKFQINFVPQTYGQMNLKLDTDNTNIGGISTTNSLLQMPDPDNPLPGYYSFKTGQGSVFVTNKGPNQAWLTTNSRIVMETLDGSTGFGAWFNSFTSPNNKNSDDSSLIPVGASQQVFFNDPCQTPTLGGGGNPCVQVGHTYRMYVYLNGYDQKGNIFLGTQYFGPVKITN